MTEEQLWSSIEVGGCGPNNARIVLVGEAPGATETIEKIPFSGSAGKILNGMLTEAGINREDVYITNVVKYQPKNNDFSVFYDKKEPSPFLTEQINKLVDEVKAINPNVVVCLGAEALKALARKTNITNWRGSVLWSSELGCKIMGTYHPAAVMRMWEWRPVAVFDLKKALKEAETKELTCVTRNTMIPGVNISYDDTVIKLTELATGTSPVSFDIETDKTCITAVAFAWTATDAISIPFAFKRMRSFWSDTQTKELWKLIKTLLESDVPKIAQNGQFDCFWLAQYPYNINVKNLTHDTMIAAHTMYAELPKGLDFLCSLYTDQPYYKDWIDTDDMRTYFTYNAMDACITLEIAYKQQTELEELGMASFFKNHAMALLTPLREMSLRGVQLDIAKAHELRQLYKSEITELYTMFREQVGFDLNVNSPKQMKTFLYDTLKLHPKMKISKTKEGNVKKVTANKEALEELARENPDIPTLATILAIRKREKILSTYLECRIDSDKRARTVYDITGTDTGRLSSYATPLGTGMNLQNIPPSIQEMFVPDHGKVFIHADLSQAEARVVAALANETQLLEVFDSGGDIHRKNAANIFNKKESEITTEERYLAKRIVHASNYGMGARRFAQTVGIKEADAKRLLNRYHATYPRIKVWHMQIEHELRKTRTLTTPLGRKRVFFSTWNENLIKSAYAFIPQSTIGDWLNMGLLEIWREIQGKDIQIMLQVHDAIILQAWEEDIPFVKSLLHKYLERPILINKRQLVIPIDIHEGKTWKACK